MNKTIKNFKKRPNHISTSSFTALSPKASSPTKLTTNDIVAIPIEKFNSKMNVWFPMYLTLTDSTIHLLEKPTHTTSKQHLTLSKKTKVKFHSLYKKIKTNVILIQIDSNALSKSQIEDGDYRILISVKNSSNFQKVQNAFNSILNQSKIQNKKVPSRNITNIRMKYTQSFRGFQTQTEMNELNDINNKQINIIETDNNKQNRGLLDMFNKNCPTKNKNFKKGSIRTRSCLEFSKEQSDVQNNCREHTFNFIPTNSNAIKINKNEYNSENIITNKKKVTPVTTIRTSAESDNLTSNTSNNVEKEENNTSLISLLNQMVSTSGKKNPKGMKKHYRSHTHAGFASNSKKAIATSSPLATPINTKKTKCMNEKLTKRKEQINKIIDLSYINENCSFLYSNNNNNNEILNNQKCYKKDELFIDINNANSNNDLSNSNVVTLGHNTSSSISSKDISPALNEIELNKIYFYDPYILKQFLIKHNLSSKHLGLLYININDKKIKTMFLSEMIARISAKFLSSSIIKSLEIVLKEKELNGDYVATSNNPHSIEYCVLDIFNTFLSVNKNNLYFNELYMKVLPVYLKEHFDLDEQISLKDLHNYVSEQNTSNLPYLFALMQYHTKIYFNSNLTLKFNSSNYPLFESSDIKYISPTNINKWHNKANEFITNLSCNQSNKEREEGINRQTLTTTNIKRIKHFTHITNDYNKIIQNFKEFDISNNQNRIYLLNSIYTYITHKQFYLALKLCDFYLQKYNDTLFLNPIIYINLSEIYYEINDDISYAKLFFNKAETVLNWLFPDNNCHFIFELNYRYLLILLKQNDNVIKSNESEIQGQMIKCEQLSEIYFNKIHYKLKIQKLLYIVNYIWKDEEDKREESEIRRMFDEIKQCLNEMVNENGINKNECGDWLYWNLFIDIFKGIKNTPNEIITEMIQLLRQSNKRKNELF